MSYLKANSRVVAACAGSLVLAFALSPQLASAQSAGVNGAPSGTGQTNSGDPKTGDYARPVRGADMGAEGVNGAPSGTGQTDVGDRKLGVAERSAAGPDMGGEGVNGAPSGTGQKTSGDPKTYNR